METEGQVPSLMTDLIPGLIENLAFLLHPFTNPFIQQNLLSVFCMPGVTLYFENVV